MRFMCTENKEAFFDDTGCGCQDKVNLPGDCTDEYKPVCGELQVNCIKAPCPPIKQTYNNRCLAEKENALNITEGACKLTGGSNFLQVTAPAEGQLVTSPVNIKGQVLSPWLSEGVALIMIVDANGKTLGSTQIKGPSDWMTRESWMDFQSSITYTKPTTPTGFVVFKKDNPSGLPANDQTVKLPVRFADANVICTKIYKPVCGETVQPNCLRAPCPALKQTFGNQCEAEAAGANNIQPGVCAEGKVTVSSPQANQIITSPVSITGQAPGTWFSEGSLPLKVVSKDGKTVLGTGVAQAQGEWMTTSLVPFQGTVVFKNNIQASEGLVVVQKDLPSGEPARAEQVTVPVKFSTAAAKATSCIISGCAGEICSEENRVSTCIARPENACYKTAQCEVQANGKCGWTQTNELTMCIKNAQKNS
jgi:hypothetical protein